MMTEGKKIKFPSFLDLRLMTLQTFPFFGVKPALLDESGKEILGEGEGYLVFDRPWPGIMRTLFGNHDRFETTYFSKFPGYYCTGDGTFYCHTYGTPRRLVIS